MKKVVLVYLFLTVLFSINSADLEKYGKKIDQILGLMEEMIEKNNVSILLERIQLIRTKLNSYDLMFSIDSKIEKNIFTGIGFAIPKDRSKKPYIYFYEEIFYLYDKQPSIVMSALMHEISHAYDFFTNEELVLVSFENELERFLFEMDAYYIEAEFINEVLKKENYKLSKFEYLLGNSLTDDNLDYFSIAFKGVDMEQVYYHTKFASSNDLETTIELYRQVGENILQNFNLSEDDDDWIKYQKIAPVFTYFYFIPQLTFDVLSNKSSKKIDNKNFSLEKEYPDLYSTWIKVREKYLEEAEFFNKLKIDINERFKM